MSLYVYNRRYMVFARSFKRIFAAPKQGEIALTLTVISLVTMLFGTVIGLNRQAPQDVRTSAAGGVQCGSFGCTKNSDCAQSPIKTLCHLASGQCRPMSTKDSCPGVTARVGGDTKQDVGGSCITATDCKTGLTCPARVCVAPVGGGSGGTGGTGVTGNPESPIPTGTTGSGVGTAFSVLELPCKVDFTFRWDPQLLSLTISDPDNPVNVFVADNSKVLHKDPAGVEGPIGKTITYPSGGSAGIFVTFDPTKSDEISITLNGGGGGLESVGRYYFRMPSWMIGSARYRVDITYEGKVAGVKHQWSQQGRAKICTNVTPTVTVPPAQVACGNECETTAQCADPERRGITCRFPSTTYVRLTPNPADKKYCLLPPPHNSRTCVPNTPTPPTGTLTPTKTPTPTATVTPTPPTSTPTPPVCRKSVYFMIDNTASQTNNILYLQDELNKFFTAFKSSYVIDYSYQTFNITAPDESGSGSNTINFQFSRDRNWTNIGMAFKEMKKAVADIKIFVSDGVVTVSGDETKSEIICVYDDNGNKINGCDPVAKNRDPATNHKTIAECVAKYGVDYYKACRAPNDPGKSNANHAIGALGAGGAGIDTDNMNKSLANGGKYHPSIDSFIKELPSILANLCPAGGSPVGPARRLSTSFSLQNKSTKTIQKVTVKTCSDQGTECRDFVNPVQVAPQQTKSFSQVIPDSVPVTSRELLTCSIGYTDGSSLPCPRKETQNESVQFKLSTTNRLVSGSAQTYLQASDINNDGRVNAIDYVLCQRQIAGSGAKSCDIIPDNVINAQDFSVVTERFGQSTQINQ